MDAGSTLRPFSSGCRRSARGARRRQLVGHDFFLFIDAHTDRPSVVYRRKGWDYGVIGLEETADEMAAARASR